MIIVNQDKDQHLSLSTKDIFYRPHFVFHKFRFVFMGWNIYARVRMIRVLLGTFDSRESCIITIEEMKQHEKAGFLRYTIPEESDGIDELPREVEYDV